MAMRMEAQALPGLALNWRQLTGVAGIIGVILFVIGFALFADYPTVNDSIDDSRTWYEDNGTRALVGSYVVAIGVVFFLVPFFLGLRSVLASAEGGEALWTQIGFFGAAIFVVLGGAAMTFGGVLALGVEELDDGSLRAMQFGDLVAFAVVGLALALYLAATGLVVLRTGALWSWLGGLQLILAVIAVIGAANMIDGDPEGVLAVLGWIGLIGFGVVILLQSVGLLTKKAS